MWTAKQAVSLTPNIPGSRLDHGESSGAQPCSPPPRTPLNCLAPSVAEKQGKGTGPRWLGATQDTSQHKNSENFIYNQPLVCLAQTLVSPCAGPCPLGLCSTAVTWEVV